MTSRLTSLAKLLRPALVTVFLALAFVATTGFGIYSFGPWRVWIVCAACAVALGLTLFRLVQPAGEQPLAHEYTLLVLAAGAVYGNWGWAGDPKLLRTLHGLMTVTAIVLAVAAVSCIPKTERWLGGIREGGLWPFFLVIAALYYSAIIIGVPKPNIDVWDHMNKAGAYLADGRNPYSIPIADYYGGKTSYGFATPGFPYPPAVLLVAWFANVIQLDVRFVLVACTFISAGFVRATARHAGWSKLSADLLAMLIVLVPRESFIVKYSHSEPTTLLLLSAAIYFLVKQKRTSGLLLLGAFFTSKQYLIVLGPLLLLYCDRLASFGYMAAGAIALWMPFLWNPVALWDAVFAVHLGRPPRKDALTLSAWFINHGGSGLPHALGPLAGAVMSTLFGLRRKMTPSTLVLGMACSLVMTLFFSPQAFSNYYILLAWMLIIAVAASGASPILGDSQSSAENCDLPVV